MEVDFSSLWRIHAADRATKNLILYWEQENNKDFRAYDLLVGNYTPLETLIMKRNSGTTPMDIMSSSVILPIVSEKFVNVLREKKITGWKTYSVKVFGKKEVEFKGFSGLTFTGHSGPIDNSKSRREHKINPTYEFPVIKYVGFYPDMSKWDGSDMFVPEGTGSVIVNEKVKDALEKANLINIKFEPITEIERLPTELGLEE